MAQAPQNGILGEQFYRQLGQTDMKVSILSCGGSHFKLDDEESQRTVREAIKAGINYFDTAPYYGMGRCQSALGQALKGVPRASYYLETKIGRTSKAEFNYTASATKELFEENLRDLGVDYVDVTLIHDVEFADMSVLINETLPTLELLRKEGKTRYIGCSAYPIEPMKELIEKSPVKIDIVLTYCRYTLFDDTLTHYVDFFKSRGVGLINAAVVGMGLLTGRGIPDWHPATEPIRNICLQATAYCQENGVQIGRLALYHALQYKKVDTTLLGMCDVVTLNRNLDVVKNGLNERELKVLHEIKTRFFKDLETKHWEGIELAKYNADREGFCRFLYEQHNK